MTFYFCVYKTACTSFFSMIQICFQANTEFTIAQYGIEEQNLFVEYFIQIVLKFKSGNKQNGV